MEEEIKEDNVSITKIILNHRGTVGFAVGFLICAAIGMVSYSYKYGQLSTEAAILRNAFDRVEYNNSVCVRAVEDNAKQNEIIKEHLPKYLEEIGNSLTPKQQKIINN